MTAAELIRACKQFEEEHGIADTLLLLNDIILARAQANDLDIEFEEDDGEEPSEPLTIQ